MACLTRRSGLRNDSGMRDPYETGRFADIDDVSHVATIADVAEVVQRMLSDLLAPVVTRRNHAGNRGRSP